MEGDISLSQSLGGLRIANPDNSSSRQGSVASPASSGQADSLSRSLERSTSAAITLELSRDSQTDGQLPQLPGDSSDRRMSQLDFDPSTFSTDSITLDQARPEIAIPPGPKEQPSPSTRKTRGLSNTLPPNHQSQQRSQFPPYSAMMSPPLRHQSASGRPASSMYSQQIPAASLPPRDASYRLHKEPSQTSLNGGSGRNGATKNAIAAVQAGVPSREESYSDRTYRTAQKTPRGNGPFPPRRSSKGVTNGQLAGSNTGSPYSHENGPPTSSEEWQEKGAAVGVRQELDANGRSVSRYVKKGVKDFHFGRTLGEGSYSTVMLATDRQTLKEFAIKVLDKRHIIKEKKVKYVNIEKDTLNRLTDHPGVVRLYYTFQDERSLYFVLDVASGGELLGVLKRMTTFDEECTRFYGAQILDTIEYMHSKGVIHRDIKPENILMDDKMHIKITDFGTAKILDTTPRRPRANSSGVPLPGDPMDGSEDNRANSFVGTAEYVSPELLTEKNACKASDLWAFGCIIYQLLAGRPPFKAANEYLTFQKIVALDYTFPRGFPPVAKDLVERLLVLDPGRRLTVENIKNHEFFDGIVWGRGLWEQKAPRLRRYTPPVNTIKLSGSPNDASNGASSFPPDIAPSHSTKPVHVTSNGNGNGGEGLSRASPRVITDLPPPSQLDIEWSPVLTRNNERILKVGNQNVLFAQAANSPSGKGVNGSSDNSKFSKLFKGSSTPKKRQRWIMITSCARIIIAAADGNEKKSKEEISLLEPGCSWKKLQDPKGLSFWCVDTPDKHITFEDPKLSSSDGSASSAAADEWVDAIERARDFANSTGLNNSYTPDDQAGLPSSSTTLDRSAEIRAETQNVTSRQVLQKGQGHKEPEESPKGFKRFSKRQSRSGLAAVF